MAHMEPPEEPSASPAFNNYYALRQSSSFVNYKQWDLLSFKFNQSIILFVTYNLKEYRYVTTFKKFSEIIEPCFIELSGF